MNTCTLCLETKPLSDFEPNAAMRSGYLNQCRKCKYARRMAAPAARERKKVVQRRWKIKSLYGMTEEQYNEMYKSQGGLCYICRQPDEREYRLSVDHCHTTGAIRRLLCGYCNLMLGNARDDIEVLQAGIAYLREQEVK